MSINFPTSLDSLTNPTSSQNLNSPSHSGQHSDANDAIEALEAKVGIDSSAVTTSLDYIVKSTSSSNPGHKHTFTSLSDFQVSGSASGDILYYNGTKYINNPANTIPIKFGGTGADGALSISSGTTTLDMANAVVFVKNYTSISITGSGALAFSNPATGGTKIILKSQGNVTLTSSAAPMIDARSLGGALGAGGDNANGATGTASGSPIWVTNAGTLATKATSAGSGGALPTAKVNSTYWVTNFDPYQTMACGAGGGGGAGEAGGSVGGNGGAGGGALIIECGGALNFTTTGGVSVSGGNGANGTGTRAGGGGGGGGGMFLLLYNTLTAASGTATFAGGTGGNCVSDGGNAYGGGGGASASTAGSNGTLSGVNGAKTGGDGAAGLSLIVKNTQFA